jgi:hypothetical protein
MKALQRAKHLAILKDFYQQDMEWKKDTCPYVAVGPKNWWWVPF